MRNLNRIYKLLFSISLILIIAGSFHNCKVNEDLSAEEQQLLAQYLTDNNITVSPTASGLYFIETQTSDGIVAQSGDRVVVAYTGKFLSGEVFDASDSYPFTLGTGSVIPGWDEGIAYMRVGSKAKIIVPSNLAYGPDGYADIPPYTTLVFEVELINITRN